MKYLWVWLLPLFLVARPFRVATYNVENLFDARFDGTEYERYIPGKHGWNARMYKLKLRRAAEVLCDADADIVALQEIENARVLTDLQRVLEQTGCAYRYGVITRKRNTPVQVALLSRFPVLQSREIRVSYAPKVRPILEVLIDTPKEPLRIFVNHWKSKAREGWESKRIAYAKALMKRLQTLDWRKPFVVLGDFNSDYNAYETLETRNDDTQGRTGINSVLPTMRGALPVSEADMRQRGVRLLYDTWYELPLSKRWSQKYYGKRGTPDHILLSPALFDGKGIDYVNQSFRVFKTEYLFTPKGYINRWEIRGGKHTARGYSDHLPLIVTLDTQPYRPSAHDRTFAPPQTATIDTLYGKTDANVRYKLHNAAVLYRHGPHAVIAQEGSARNLFVYGGASQLRQGFCYDVIVEGVKSYKGLREVTAAYAVHTYETCFIKRFIRRGNAAFYQGLRPNDVVADLTGVYRHGFFYLDGGGKIRIYFKKRTLRPPDGSRIKIDYARIGYYKGLEIVIESKKNFHVVE